MRTFISGILVLFFVCVTVAEEPADNELAKKISAQKEVWTKQRTTLSEAIKQNPDAVELYSRRGDLAFYLGDFPAAVSDYQKMIELNPDLKPGHWRNGIALFYAGKYEQAAAQFDAYHSFDNVDRENGIWRYFSHFKAFGKAKAQEQLLKYEKDDREPFPSVYKLFAGKITPAEILKQIESAKISDTEKEKRLFYARLYIGLNAAIEGDEKEAVTQLERVLPNSWGPEAGYGPHYMWQAGRLHLELLRKETAEREQTPPE